ncbi:MAG: hypothetical protein HKM05_01740 [Spirochaetales bacterium]|nr:hypothetical protein [Spirochaetales bacterium]
MSTFLVPASALSWLDGLDPGLKQADSDSLPILAVWLPSDTPPTFRDQWITAERSFPFWWKVLPHFLVPVRLRNPAEVGVFGLDPDRPCILLLLDGKLVKVWYNVPLLLDLSHEIAELKPLKNHKGATLLPDPYTVVADRLVSESGLLIWQRQADGPRWVESGPGQKFETWTEQTIAGPLILLENKQGGQMALPQGSGWSWVQLKDGAWKAGEKLEAHPTLGGKEVGKPLH